MTQPKLLPPAQTVLELLPRAFDSSKFPKPSYWLDYIPSELRTITGRGNIPASRRPKLHLLVKDSANLPLDFVQSINVDVCAQIPALINAWTWSSYGENWSGLYTFFGELARLTFYRGSLFSTIKLDFKAIDTSPK